MQHTCVPEEVEESNVLVETNSAYEDETVQFTNKTAETHSEVEENDVSSVEYLSKCLQTKPMSTSARDRATSLCKKIEVALLNCINMDAIATGMKHLSAAYTVINAMDSRVINDGEFATRKRVAPNTNFEKETHLNLQKSHELHPRNLFQLQMTKRKASV